MEDSRSIYQHVTSLEQDAQQPCLAIEADRPANIKTRKRTEGAATAVQAMHRDSCPATRVEPGPKTNSTNFGIMAEPLDFPCREDVFVENGDASPKSCVPSLEMCSPSAASGLLHTAGEISTATKTTFNQSPLWLSTKETNCKKTSTPYVSYDSSFWNLLVAPSCRRVINTKSIQNRTFDPGGFQGCLRACSFLGSWRALLCREVHVRAG